MEYTFVKVSNTKKRKMVRLLRMLTKRLKVDKQINDK